MRSSAKTTESIDQIIVPVDFSQSSFEALEYAIEFAERVAARLIVFHAVHLGYAFSADGYAMCRSFRPDRRCAQGGRTTDAKICATGEVPGGKIRNRCQDCAAGFGDLRVC